MTTYSYIASNTRKTWLLMGVFFVVLIFCGFLFSRIYGNPYILFGFVAFSLIMNVTSFWFSDRIALASAHAEHADSNTYKQLHRSIENLAITAGIPKPGVYIIHDNAPNAFATGRDPQHASVAVTTGLLNIMNEAELQGVLAHELSHIKNRDILIMSVVVVLVGFVSLLADFLMRISMFGGSRDDNGSNNPLSLILMIALAILMPIIAMIIQLAISRKREFLADSSGVLLTRYPEGLARALAKIEHYSQPMEHASTATAHLFISNPFGNMSNGFLKLFATHPPIAERISALHDMGGITA